MKQPARVLFVSHQGNLRGGADQSLLDLILGLDRARFAPVVLLPRIGQMADILSQHRIKTVIVSFRAWADQHNNLFKIGYRTAFNAVSLVRLARRLRPIPVDVVYSNSLYTPIGALLARYFNLPHIWHVRELMYEDFGKTYDFGVNWSMRFVDQSSAQVITNSTIIDRKMARYISEKKLNLIYNGFPGIDVTPPPVPRSGLLSNGEVVLCLVGRIAPHKGQDDAVRALAQLRAAGVNARLRLAGTGHNEHVAAVKTLATDLGVAEHVIWEGFVENVQTIYATTDITLMCSRSEAFGRVVVEAMAAGCPVIGTRAGGVPDIITDGENGLLYEPENHEALAALVHQLAVDHELYGKLSANGIATAYSRFTLRQYVEAVQAVIEKTLNNNVSALDSA